jgi:hypothetical protein
MQALESWIVGVEALTGMPRQLLVATAILLGGWLLALVARAIVGQIVLRWTRAATEDGQDALADAVARHRTDRVFARATYWLVILIALMGATEVVGLATVSSWLATVAIYLPRVFAAFIIGIAGVVFGSLARVALAKALPISELVDPERIGRVVRLLIIGVSVLVAVQQLGVDVGFVTTLLAIMITALLGAGALAFGLGGKATVANILGTHYARELYHVGQTVRVGDVEGQLVRVTATTVVLDTPDGQAAVPGSAFSDSATLRVVRHD